MVLRKVCTCGNPITTRTTYCRECARNRSREYYHRNERNRLKVRAKAKEYREKHKEQVLKQKRVAIFRLKRDVIRHYSHGTMVCALCKEGNILVLSIDHINGGGNRERKRLQRQGQRFYQWLKNKGYPEGYRVLCMNCQWKELWKAKVLKGGYDFLKEMQNEIDKDGWLMTCVL